MASKLQFGTRTDVYTLIQIYEELMLIWLIVSVATLNGTYNLVLERDYVGATILFFITIAALLKCWLARYKKQLYVRQGKLIAEQILLEQRMASGVLDKKKEDE